MSPLAIHCFAKGRALKAALPTLPLVSAYSGSIIWDDSKKSFIDMTETSNEDGWALPEIISIFIWVFSRLDRIWPSFLEARSNFPRAFPLLSPLCKRGRYLSRINYGRFIECLYSWTCGSPQSPAKEGKDSNSCFSPFLGCQSLCCHWNRQFDSQFHQRTRCARFGDWIYACWYGKMTFRVRFRILRIMQFCAEWWG